MKSVCILILLTSLGISNGRAAETKLGFDISLNVNELLELIMDRTERAWARWNIVAESRAIPQLSATYIHVGVLFDSLARQMIRTIPGEFRQTECLIALGNQDYCTRLIDGVESKLDSHISNEIIRSQLQEVWSQFNELKELYDELGASIVMDDPRLLQEAGLNFSAPGVALTEADMIFEDLENTQSASPKNIVQLAHRFKQLGAQAVSLGERFSMRMDKSK